MPTLTRTVKAEMIEVMLNKAISAERESLRKDWREFALKVYKDVYGEKLIAELGKIPIDFCNVESGFKVKLGNKLPRLELGQCLPTKRRAYSDCQKDYGYHHEFVSEFDELEQRQQDLDNKHKTLKIQIGNVINSVTTFARLWKVWPECRPVLKHYEGSKPQSIAIVMPELNAACGLPVEESHAKT